MWDSIGTKPRNIASISTRTHNEACTSRSSGVTQSGRTSPKCPMLIVLLKHEERVLKEASAPVDQGTLWPMHLFPLNSAEVEEVGSTRLWFEFPQILVLTLSWDSHTIFTANPRICLPFRSLPVQPLVTNGSP
eukprot:PhF_6_TR15965/c0_g1_i1/m.24921